MDGIYADQAQIVGARSEKMLVLLRFSGCFSWDDHREFKDNGNYREILKSRVLWSQNTF